AVVTPAKDPEGVALPSGLPVTAVGSRLHIADVDKGGARPVGPEGGASYAAVWSPDGKRLAFYSDAGGSLKLWLHDVDSGKSRTAPDLPVHALTFLPPVWTRDGTSILSPARTSRERDLTSRKRERREEDTVAHASGSPGVTVRVFGSGGEESVVPRT